MKTITVEKYITKDGLQFESKSAAETHEIYLDKIKQIEDNYLGGPQCSAVEDNKGYYQHRKSSVEIAWAHVVDISRPYFKSYDQLMNAAPSEIHPLGFGGRVISECGNKPLNHIWWRFSCIDSNYREWQQTYFAINGPDSYNNKQVN